MFAVGGKRRSGKLILGALCFIGVLISVFVSYSVIDGLRRARLAEVESRLNDLVGLIETEVNIHLTSIRAMRAHFTDLDSVGATSFSTFAESIRAAEVGTISYGWAPRIVADERDAFETFSQRNGFPGFEIRDIGGEQKLPRAFHRAEYFPALFMEPFEAVQTLSGVDLLNVSGVREALRDSIDQDEVMLYLPSTENGDFAGRHTILAFYPLFHKGQKGFLVDQRRRNVSGILFGVYNISGIVAYAIRNSSIDDLIVSNAVGLKILSGRAGDDRPFFESENFTQMESLGTDGFLQSVHAENKIFKIGQLPLQIQMIANPDAAGIAHYGVPISVLLIGFILTGTLAAFTESLMTRERRVRVLVNERTQALEESEQRVRDMAEVAADWFWETDQNMRFIYLSPRLEEITGIRVERYMGRTREEVAAENIGTLGGNWEVHRRDLAARRPFRDFRYSLQLSSGGDRFFAISGKPIYASDGLFLGYRGSGRDVTEEESAKRELGKSEERLHRYIEELEVSRKYLEENTAEMAELADRYVIEKNRAEASERSKSEFLASMSHEIRTPMAGVIGFADMLLDSKIADDEREMVLKIKSATMSLMTIVNDILDLSKLEAGRLLIENLDFNIKFAINDALELVRDRAIAKGLTLSIDFPAEMPDGINGDPTRFRQILINLIGNAVKFTQDGGVTVTISISMKDEQQMIRVGVADTGIGISADNQKRLFTNFAQADASISRKYSGTGLGLAISKRLVELMGGDIGVESVEGSGSEFWFTMPYLAATSDVTQISRLGVPQDFDVNRALNILVVEDNKLNQQIIAAILDKYGHHVVIVDNGVHALTAVGKDEFDLILMDIRMPEMSGPEAARAIRGRSDEKAKIPIIALTADAVEENIRGYIAVGMNACVTKPIDRQVLLRTINEVLDEEIHTAVMIESEAAANTGENAPSVLPAADSATVASFLHNLEEIADIIEKDQ